MAKDIDIINLTEQRKKIQEEILRKNSIDDIENTKSIYESRLIAENHDPLLRRMNDQYAFIHSIGGKPMVKTLVYNEFFEKEITEFITCDSVILRHSNESAEGTSRSGKEASLTLGKWWLGHTHRKDYETVTFEPHKQPGEYRTNQGKIYYNMWEGFSVEPKKGSWKLTRKHIYNILCNKDKIKFKYTIKWLAWAIQNPGNRAEVAVIFKGKKGAGKGFIFTQMIKLFARHGMSISNREHLTGKFNSHLQNLCFLFADEAYYPGDKEVEGVLKQLITEPSLTVEPKFQGTKLSRNCLHIGMATNADWVIPATTDERRYFINAVDNKYAKGEISDKERTVYFTNLWNEMSNEGLSAFLYSMLKINLKGWHPREDIPETTELANQILISMSKPQRAIFNLLEEGVFPGSLNKKGEYIITRENFMEYIYKLDNGAYKNITSKYISDILIELRVQRHRDAIKRSYIFQPLPVIRDLWDKKIIKYEKWLKNEDWIIGKTAY